MRSGCVGVAAIALLVPWARVRADEEKVPLDKLPAAVAKALKKRFPNAEWVNASKETEEGKTLYEVALRFKGHKYDATVTAEGQLHDIEKEIAAKDAPAAVANALDAKYPKAKIERAEEITHVRGGKETLSAYEFLLVTAAGKKVEVVVSPEGKITKEEAKDKKDKD